MKPSADPFKAAASSAIADPRVQAASQAPARRAAPARPSRTAPLPAISRLVAALVLACLTNARLPAGTIYWTGDLGNNWDTFSVNSNWSTSISSNIDYGKAPQTGDALVFSCNSSTNFNPTMNGMAGLQLLRITFNHSGAWLGGNGVTLTGDTGYDIVATNTSGTNRASTPVTLGTGKIDQATGGTLWLDGGISTTNLIKTGGGTLKIGNLNTWTGETQVHAGTLLLDRVNTLPATTTLVLNGGSVDLGGYGQAITGLRLADGLSLNTGTATLSVSSLVELGNGSVLSGSVSLVTPGKLKAGASDTATVNASLSCTDLVAASESSGTIVLAGNGSGIVGNFRVDGGTLRVGASNALPTARTLTVNAGTFDLNGYSLSVAGLNFGSLSTYNYVTTGTGSLSLTGNVTADAAGYSSEISGLLDMGIATRTFNVANSTAPTRLLVSAAISGTGGLTKTGVGTLALTGNNTFSGPVTVSLGTLKLGSATALTSANPVTVNGATLKLNGFDVTSGAVGMTGGVLDTGTNTLTVPSMTATGNATIGNVRLNVGGTQGLTINGGTSDTITLAGVLSGPGRVRITGGTVLMDGTNTYEGGTLVEGGVLDLSSSPGAITSPLIQSAGTKLRAGGVTLSNPFATLGACEVETFINNLTLTGTTTLGGTLTKTGEGNLSIATTVTGTGGFTIQEGKLTVESGGDISAFPLCLNGTLTECVVNTATATILDLSGAATSSKVRAFDTIVLNNQNDTIFDGSLFLGNFVKTGPAALTITEFVPSGVSLRIEQGTLRAGDDIVFNNADLTLAGGTLDLDTHTISKFLLAIDSGEISSGLGELRIGSGGTIYAFGLGPSTISTHLRMMGGCTLTVHDGPQDNDLVLSRDWRGAGPLDKRGSGVLALTGTENIFDHTLLRLYEGTTRIHSGPSLDVPTAAPADVCQLLGGTLEVAGSFGLTSYQRLNVGTGSQLLQVSGSDVFTVPSPLTGSGKLVKSGSGVLVLSGYSDLFTGTIRVAEGTLRLGSSDAIPNRITEVIGTLDVNGRQPQITRLDLTGGTVTTGSGILFATAGVQALPSSATSSITGNLWVVTTGATIPLGVSDGAADVDLRIDADIRAGLLDKTGAGVLELSGSNIASGTLIEQGELRVGSGGLNPAGYVEMRSGTQLNVVSGAPAVSQLRLNGATATSTAGVLHLDRVTCAASTGTSTLTGSLHFDGQPALLELASGSTLALAADISATNVSMTGPGTLELTSLTGVGELAANTGTVRLMNGTASGSVLIRLTDATLALNSLIAEVAGLNLTRAIVSGGTLQLLADVTVQSSTTPSTIAGQLSLASSRTFTVTSGTAIGLQVDAAVGGTGDLIKAGAGTMVLTATNSFVGRTEITGGTLSVTTDANLGATPATPVADHLRLSSGGLLRVEGSGFTLPANRGIALLGSGGGFDVVTGAQLTLNAPVSGAGGLGKTGPGTLVLSGAGSYLGTTSVTAGALALGSSTALPTGNAVSVTSATLGLAGFNATLSSLTLGTGTVGTGGGLLTVGGVTSLATGTSLLQDSVALAGTEVVFNVADGTPATDLDVPANLSGSGGLAKTGAGTLKLRGTNNYGGSTRIAAGTLLLGSSSALPSGNSIRLEGGTLDTGSQSISSTSLELFAGSILTGTGTLNLQGNLLKQGSQTAIISGNISLGTADRTFDVTGRLEVPATIGGSGGLIKTGSGDLVISATAYTGATSIQAGKLILGANNLLQGTVPILHGAELSLNGKQDTIDWLDLTGSATVTPGTGGKLTLAQGVHVYSGSSTASTSCPLDILAASTVFDVADSPVADDFVASGVVGGTGGLWKSGAGLLALTTANTYSGGTNVTGGTLAARAANALPTGRSLAVTGASVDISIHDQAVSSLTLAGGQVTGSSGKLALTSLTSQAAATTSTVSCPLDVGTSIRNVTVANGTAAIDLQISGDISGQSGVTISASGATVLLSGSNTYQGTTCISSGTVLLGSTTAVPSGGALEVLGVLETQNLGIAVGDISLTGGTIRTGTGVLTLSTGVTIGTSATTSLIEGRLGFGSQCRDFNVGNGAAATDLDVAAIVSGSAGFTKSGSGTMIISGSSANTCTGMTVVNSGVLALNKSGASAIVDDVTVNGGTLRLDAANQLGAACDLTIHGGTVDTGSLTSSARSLTLDAAAVFSGAGGNLAANFLGGVTSDLTASGDVSLGNAANYNGFRTAGEIHVGTAELNLNCKGFASLGILTTMTGGTLNAPNGVLIGPGMNFSGRGTVGGRVAAGFGSTIEATGTLALGNNSATDGFFSDGTLAVGHYTVTLNDSNAALLGSQTTLGDLTGAGTLTGSNGLALPMGNNLTGYGIVNGSFLTDGYVKGEGPAPADDIRFNGAVTGFGDFAGNITFGSSYLPGHSPDAVNFENLTLADSNTLFMELGGTTPDSGYDQLLVGGALTFGGRLSISLINSFQPAAGDLFNLFDWGSRTGTFSTLEMPSLTGLAWDTSALYTTGTLAVQAVIPPAPTNFTATTQPGLAVRLQWQDTSPPAPGFEIQRASDPGFTANLQNIPVLAGQTFRDDTDLPPEATFHYRIRALGPPNPSNYSAPTQATTPTRLADWRWVHFGNPNPVGNGIDLADPDHDGAMNLLEYCCNLNPNQSDAGPLATDGTAGVPVGSLAPDGHLKITFLRRTADSLPAVTQGVVFSDNLATWATEPAAATTIEPINALWERVTVTDPASPGAKRFARMAVTNP